ncbi:MAG: alanine racemase [Alkalibacterium sp.]
MTARLTLNKDRLTKQALLLQSEVDTIAIVKNEAYNHGLETAYQAFYKGGIRAFATTNLSEAVQLRQWDAGIFILLMDPHTHFQTIRDHDIALTVSSLSFYEKYKEELKDITIQLVYRNDLNRMGFTQADQMKHILEDPDMNVNGLWTHFASADDFGIDRYEKEVSNWQAVLAELQEYLPSMTYIHAQNSASYLRDRLLPYHTHVRGGVVLYGTRPYYDGLDETLAEQTISIQANVIELTPVKAGQSIGYSAAYQVDKDTVIAVCDIGYGNGLIKGREAFPVIINQKSYPIRVMMMSHLLVEVDPDIKIGDTVHLYNDDLRFDWFTKQGLGSFSEQTAGLNKETFDIHFIG